MMESTIQKTGFLKEEGGGYSSARLVFVIGSVWIMALCSYMAIKGADIPGLIALYSAIQGVLIGLKLGQKPMEEKILKK
jgi:hypothetical protein